MMKKILLTLFVGMSLTANAQYQLANSGFEEWESLSSGEEPVKWSSFVDGTGSMKSMAGKVQIAKINNDLRPGTNGNYSVKINARSVVGVIAQGNLTTGCVNMGSMTATDASGNYNYINEQRSDQAMRFSGHPDALRVWVKFSGSKPGKVSALLTTKGYYQDPISGNRNTAALVSQATKADIPSNGTWTQYDIPFTENAASLEPYYAFVNISTSNTPGAGSASDYMFVDDMEMVYYSEATAIVYDGQRYGMSDMVNKPFDPSKLTAVEMNGRASTWESEFDYNKYELRVTVKGENISEAPDNKHTYSIKFKKPNAQIATATQDGVDLLANAESVIYDEAKCQLTFTSDVKSHSLSFDISTCRLTVTMTDAFGDEYVQIIQFHKPQPAIASLKWHGMEMDPNTFSTTDVYQEDKLVLVPNADATLEASFNESTLVLTVLAKAPAGYELFNRTYRFQFGMGQLPNPADEVIEPVEFTPGVAYYIRNKSNQLFLNADCALSHEGTVWTCGSDKVFTCSDGRRLVLAISANSGWFGGNTPTYVSVYTSASETTTVDVRGDVSGYTLSRNLSWTYGFANMNSAEYTIYVGADANNVIWNTVGGSENTSSDAFKWQFIPLSAVENRQIRIELYEELTRCQQMGMDIITYRQEEEKNKDNTAALTELLYRVRADQFRFVESEYTENKTTALRSTDLTNTGVWNTNMSKNTDGGQHWKDASTAYYEQGLGMWDSSSPWDSYAIQEVELPAGYYMVKATARSSEHATSYLQVGDEVVSFPAKGDVGRGVDTQGNVNYSANGTYVNNNNGRGWEYRYLSFVVKNPGDKVKISIGGSCKGMLHQWISISDIELLAKPTPTLSMLNFIYDGTSYSPSEDGTIMLSDVYYKEEIVPEIQTAGYGEYEMAFDSTEWALNITLKQEQKGLNYGFADKEYKVYFRKPNPALASLTFDGNDILALASVDEYYNPAKLQYVGNSDAEKVQVKFDRSTSVLTIVCQGSGFEKVYTIAFKDASTVSTTYTEEIVVKIENVGMDGMQECEPVEGTVYITENGNGAYSFELPNFQLLTDGMRMDIGTIVLTGIQMQLVQGSNLFTAKETITIAAGDMDDVPTEMWYGPWLGEIPVDLKTGVIYAGRMYCEIVIDMVQQMGQTIHVTVGNKDATGIESVDADGQKQAGAVYDLSGRRTGETAKGVLIVGGRKVIVR
ncbi:MAG: calycin-like domain-containing protein [Bacteroidaceae bacterium]|nr:calycin-like domain-containing protein [Bacteroidaceae bacterium]